MRPYNPQYRRTRDFYFSIREVRELVIAWAVISVAFMFALTPGMFSFSLNALILSAITVGIGFLLHELAHKFVAQYYRCHAEFRSNNGMLVLALVLAGLSGFVFAAPGAVMIEGVRLRKHLGHIAIAGPITNVVLALLFLAVPGAIGTYGFQINAWLALFNMIPFGPLDGAKVLAWNKVVFGAMIAVCFALLVIPIVLAL